MLRSLFLVTLFAFVALLPAEAMGGIPDNAWIEQFQREAQACRMAAPKFDKEAVKTALAEGQDINPLLAPTRDALQVCADGLMPKIEAVFAQRHEHDTPLLQMQLNALMDEDLLLNRAITDLDMIMIKTSYAAIMGSISPRVCLSKVPRFDRQAIETAIRAGEDITPLIAPTLDKLEACSQLAKADLQIWEVLVETHPAMEVPELREEAEMARNNAFFQVFVADLAISELRMVALGADLYDLR